MNAFSAQEIKDREASMDERREEREMLRASAIDFVRGTTDHARTRAQRDRLPGYDQQVVRQIAELGWCGILIPEEYGGLGLGFAEMGVVLEELGKGLLGNPVVAATVLAGRALQHGDNESLKQGLLPRLAEGRLLPFLAWQEEAGGLDPAAISTQASIEGDRVVLNGRKCYVVAAGNADGFLVTARSGDGIGLYWVRADAPGLAITYDWLADGTPSARLELVNVVLDSAQIAASHSIGLSAVSRAVDEAVVMACAEMCGVMRATFEMMLEYLRTRVQFNKPIGSFQVVQHRAVDSFIQQELASAVLNEAIAVLDNPAQKHERLPVASRAKARVSSAGMHIAREAIQFHGAIAIQDECDVGLYLKRALVLSAWLGNSTAHRNRYSAHQASSEQG